MSFQDLLPALRKLDRGDKLRAMQFLVGELSREEGLLLEPEREYPIWSPYDAFEAAEDLLKALNMAEPHQDAQR